MAWCHPGSVTGAFMDSVFGTLLHDVAHGKRILRHGGYIANESGPRVAEARSQIVNAFLTTPNLQEAEWLWMVDVDMKWEPEALDQLLAVADRDKRPIVGGLCFAGGRSDAIYPTLYKLTDTSGTVERIFEYPEDKAVKVDATGAAFLLVHRRVLHQMGVVFGTQPNGNPNPYPWFMEGMVNQQGDPYGEDIAFCLRANHLGIPIYVHTGVRVGHMKSYELTEERYRASRAQMVENS